MKPFANRVNKLSVSQTVAIDTKAKALLAAGKDIISLGAGEPSESTPDFICDAAYRATKEGKTKYAAAAGIPELKEEICKKFKKDNVLRYHLDNITISSGAKHCIFNSLLALINPGDEVIIPSPYWVTYPELVTFLGGVPIIIPGDVNTQFKISAKQLASVITPRTKLFILNSPCNPTGTVYSHDELSELSDVIVKNDIYCLSDEIYEKILYDNHKHHCIASLNDDIKKRSIVVNGVSKSYAMTGWRIGYTACEISLAKVIGKIQSQSTLHPATPSQYAALAALKSGNDFIGTMTEGLKRNRQTVIQYLEEIPSISFTEPAGAFYFFIDVSKFLKANNTGISNSTDLCTYLLDDFLLATVPGSAFGHEGFIRISFTAPPAKLAEGLQRLKQALNP
ncbi:MAG: pyridoxal phosphate-dependent aminotransferase [Fibrobacteria bacterium]|nr:pyridoxal phosphate-dependent aminotransferase [Fibrobacteria bacterium]